MQKERRIPLGYQEKLLKHLQQLKEHDVIEGLLDSTVGHKWISNVVLAEKKTQGKNQDESGYTSRQRGH